MAANQNIGIVLLNEFPDFRIIPGDRIGDMNQQERNALNFNNPKFSQLRSNLCSIDVAINTSNLVMFGQRLSA